MNELELMAFQRSHQIVPRDLKSVHWAPSEDDSTKDLLKHYEIVCEDELPFEILCQSNLIGKNIRFLWMLNYELESYLLKRKFPRMREQYEI